ncbi:scaffolding protein [Microbacterium phage Zayuliv]|nr:scaffolding protein [Microbacterium phage Zayuliv]
MAPQDQENNGSTGETQDQEQQDQQQQAAAGETQAGEQQQPVTIDDSTQLPDTHPLVKTLKANKDKISSLTSELTEARSQSSKATQLEEELGKRPTTEAMETLQTRYDRLEEFVLAVGLGKALDSRTFTKDLFETDKDITVLVRDWNKANPSATSTALASTAGGQQADGKQDPNQLIRIAAGKA